MKKIFTKVVSYLKSLFTLENLKDLIGLLLISLSLLIVVEFINHITGFFKFLASFLLVLYVAITKASFLSFVKNLYHVTYLLVGLVIVKIKLLFIKEETKVAAIIKKFEDKIKEIDAKIETVEIKVKNEIKKIETDIISKVDEVKTEVITIIDKAVSEVKIDASNGNVTVQDLPVDEDPSKPNNPVPGPRAMDVPVWAPGQDPIPPQPSPR